MRPVGDKEVEIVFLNYSLTVWIRLREDGKKKSRDRAKGNSSCSLFYLE